MAGGVILHRGRIAALTTVKPGDSFAMEISRSSGVVIHASGLTGGCPFASSDQKPLHLFQQNFTIEGFHHEVHRASLER